MSTSMSFTPDSASDGTSGVAGERCAPPEASMLSLPAFTSGSATCTGRNMSWIWPLSRSVTAPAVPLYGTCTRLQAEVQLEQFHRQVVRRRVAGRGVVELARLRLRQRDEFRHVARRHRGMRHQRQVADRGEADRRQRLRVVGHGLVAAPRSAPAWWRSSAACSRPPAPWPPPRCRCCRSRRAGSRSTTGIFSRSCSFCPQTRARMSMPVPGVKGTTSLMGRSGYWACAPAGTAARTGAGLRAESS